MALSGSFLSMLTITAFIILSFIKFVTSFPGRLKFYLGLHLPRLIKSLLETSINGNKFNKGSLEFHNHRFVDNYESSFLDLVF